MARKRRIWKEFQISSASDFGSLLSCWQSLPQGKWKAIFTRTPGGGMLETNLPLKELRALFRSAQVDWIDYVSGYPPSESSNAS